MKKITILLVIIFTFLFTNTSWGEWSYVEEDVYNGNKFYYDKDRVRKNGKYLYFWKLVDYYISNKWGNLSETSYIQLDCSIFRYKNLKNYFYKNYMGKGGFTDFTPKDEWDYPKPNSVMEYMCNFVCEEHQ